MKFNSTTEHYMRFGHKHSFQKNPASYETREIGMLSIEGDEGGDLGGGGGAGDNEPAPFTVSKEDWEATQSQLRESNERYMRLEGEHRKVTERFKPFLEGDQGGDDKTPRAPDRNDTSRYPRTPEGAQKFLDDYTDYRYALNHQRTTATASASAREQQEAAQESESTNKLVTEHMKRVSEFAKAVPDFDKVTNSVLITFEKHAPLAKAILRLKNSAAVEYHLAKNPTEAMQLIRTASVDMDEAKEVLFGLNHKYSEEARKTAARKQAERAGGYAPTHSVEGEHAAGGDDAADEDFIKGRFGLGSKK
jgi:hypothetical protein